MRLQTEERDIGLVKYVPFSDVSVLHSLRIVMMVVVMMTVIMIVLVVVMVKTETLQRSSKHQIHLHKILTQVLALPWNGSK